MRRTFYIDRHKSLSISYEEVLAYVNECKSYCPLFLANNEIEFYLNLIISLVANKNITLLDLDLSIAEVSDLVDDPSYVGQREKVSMSPISSIQGLFNAISRSTSVITLFTSGTTGQSKKISHHASHFVSSTRLSQRHRDASWAFAYNPTHMAGLQVFFQAVLNGNKLVNVFNRPRQYVIEEINNNQITNISATPTFYKMLLPVSEKLTTVRGVTSGGEKIDPVVMEKIKDAFPNAKIFNIYASTEAGSLFVSKGDAFVLDNNFARKVKVVEDELVLHKSLLGIGDYTFEFEDWYKTGDMVEVLSHEPLTFKFVSRKSELVNIGGYNVNPVEIETRLMSIAGVVAARVYGKPNSVMGNILVAEIIKSNNELTEGSIKDFLKQHLQLFKIPRIIKFVDEIKLTRSGKISRQKSTSDE